LTFFNAGQALKKSGRNLSELYYTVDFAHYSVLGNKVISAVLREKIEKCFRILKYTDVFISTT
jgi:hypothetical protein